MGGELRWVIKLVFYICFGISSGTIAENVGEVVHSSKEQIKSIAKRYDLDFQTCLDNFDIHTDKIIRTQDSRAMGAKYINEIDLSTREECLRFCCETNTCDVFVFEEKNPGSCYLFHCGAPDDFKCKFTKHHNYTSAVLAFNRHMTELEDQIKLTKHEQELTRLRKPETAAEQSTVSPLSPTTVVPARPLLKETIQLTPAASNATISRRCSRYQFECHSSGECIAIYNACDGIPQCADGSDEAVELDCPDLGRTLLDSVTGTTQAPPAMPTLSAVNDNRELVGNGPVSVISPFNNLQQQHQHMNVNQQIPSQVINSAADSQQLPVYTDAGTGSLYRQQQGWSQAQQPPGSLQQPQQYVGTQSNSNGVNLGSNQKLFPNNQQQQQQQQQIQGNKQYGREGEGVGYSGGSNPQWQTYQQQQMSPAVTFQGAINQFQGANNHGYEDQNSHIFNHKGNGLVTDSDSPAAQYGDTPHSEYKYSNNGPNGYYNNGPYRPPAVNWQPHQLPTQDLNPMPAIDDIPPHLNDDRNGKMGPDRIRGRYNTGPIPPDYYYEDSQEGKLHLPHAHGSEDLHQPPNNHPAQVEQENTAGGTTSVKAKDQKSNHKFQSSLEAKLEADLSNTPRRKGSIDVHIVESQTKSSTEATTVTTEATKTLHEQSLHLMKNHKVTVNMEELNLSETNTEEEEPGSPSGAILSLALGLCITGIMVVLVACRLRVVRRRLRRGGKSPYAHDADYLVNGMYL